MQSIEELIKKEAERRERLRALAPKVGIGVISPSAQKAIREQARKDLARPPQKPLPKGRQQWPKKSETPQ
jgi:hypothetical protein